MKWIQDWKRRGVLALAVSFMAAFLLNPCEAEKMPPALAWWGILYPRYCFSETETNGNQGEKPELSLWVAEALDW